MAKIYTKTGDEGMTSLVGGKRVRKSCARLEAYGDVDELNSQLGLLLVSVSDETARKCIEECQNTLFSVGAILASEIESGKVSGQTVPDDEIKRLETLIDEWNAILPPWRGFVLPGGIESASRAQVCRTVCRRAERHIHLLAETELVPSEVMQYMNRLSDLLFVMALRENFLAGKEEIIWRKRGQ